MNYKIIGFNTVTGQLTVRYNNRLNKTFILEKDENNCVITGDELKEFILSHTPFELLVDNPSINVTEIKNSEEILSLVEPFDNDVDNIVNLSSITEAKASSVNLINHKASVIRREFLLTDKGQEYAYIIKGLLVTKFKNNNYQGDVPAYVVEEANLSGKTFEEVAFSISNKFETYTKIVDPLIEAVRVVRTSEILNQTSIEDIVKIYEKAIEEFKNIEIKYIEEKRSVETKI